MKNKLVLIVFGLIALLVVCLAAGAFLLSQGRQQGEAAQRNANPTFHTVEEGGTCRPDMGDCKAGLTCAEGICAKP